MMVIRCVIRYVVTIAFSVTIAQIIESVEISCISILARYFFFHLGVEGALLETLGRDVANLALNGRRLGADS